MTVNAPKLFRELQMKLKTCFAAIALIVATLSCGLAGSAQDPLRTLPNNYKLLYENDDVLVIRAHYGAHEKIPVHDHSAFATVFVYLNNSGQVRIDHAEPGEKPVSVLRPPTVKGAYRVAGAIAERHSIENLGDSNSDFLRVELKHAALQLKEPFRGKAPQDLAQTSDVVEFHTPEVAIERIVCVASSACQVKPEPASSLLIALTPLIPVGVGNTMIIGAVRWLPSLQALSFSATAAGEPAYLLRIVLPGK